MNGEREAASGERENPHHLLPLAARPSPARLSRKSCGSLFGKTADKTARKTNPPEVAENAWNLRRFSSAKPAGTAAWDCYTFETFAARCHVFRTDLLLLLRF